MPRQRLTDAIATKAQPQANRVFLWDTEVTKLALLVYPSGQKSWIAQWHKAGRDIRVALGHFPVLTVKEARRKALDALSGVSATLDASPAYSPSRTFQDASRAYLSERLGDKASLRKVTDILGRVVPQWFRVLPLGEVTMDALRRAHQERHETPGMANNMVGVIRTVINFAVEKRWLAASPLATKMDLYPAVRKKKALTETQYRAMVTEIRARYETQDRLQWLALEAIVLTGGRKTEILSLKYDEIDRERMVITKKDHKTAAKTGAKEIPITEQFLAVLDRVAAWKADRVLEAYREPVIAQRMEESPFVFPAPGRREGREGYLANVDDDAHDLFVDLGNRGVIPEGFYIHNLRSAFVSMAMAQGLDVAVVAKMVGHKDVQTTLKHYRAVNEDEVNQGRDAVSRFFGSL
jgi:integrase